MVRSPKEPIRLSGVSPAPRFGSGMSCGSEMGCGGLGSPLVRNRTCSACTSVVSIRTMMWCCVAVPGVLLAATGRVKKRKKEMQTDPELNREAGGAKEKSPPTV